MVAVTIDSGELPSARGKTGHELNDVLRKWKSVAQGQFPYDCNALLQMIDEVDELKMWEYGAEGFYKTRDEFLEKVVLIDFDLTEQSLSEIVAKLRQGKQVRLEPVHTHQEAGAMGGRGNKASDNITSFRGTSKKYLLARLKRYRPELAARVIADELSANAAAVEAGWRERTIQHAPTLEGFARAIEKHLDHEQRTELKARL